MKENIWIKVFRMNILPIITAVILFMLLGNHQVRRFANIMEQTNREQNETILDTMSEVMEKMAMENFQKYVVSEARLINGEFLTLRHDMEILAKQVQNVLEEPFPSDQTQTSALRIMPPSLNRAGKLTLQLVWSDKADPSDPVLAESVRRIGGLDDMMLEIIQGGTSLISCMVSLPDGTTIFADNAPEFKLRSDGTLLPFNAIRRPWYVGALVHGKTYFSPVNEDYYTGIRQVMVGVPVYVKGKLAAVCGGAIKMQSMGDILSDAQIGRYTSSCLINEAGNVLYSSRTTGSLGMDDNHLKSLMESSNAELVSLVDKALKGETGFSLLTIDNEELYIAYAPVETVGWSQLLMISREDLNRAGYFLTRQTDTVMNASLNKVHSIERRTILDTTSIAAIAIVIAVLTSLLLADSLVRPIREMTDSVSKIEGNDMIFHMKDSMRTGNEIELLARAFENMSLKMKGYVHEIVQITAENQRLETELSVASTIQANMLPNHFPAFPDRREFDLYAVMDPAKEVGGDFYDFYLIDPDHLALVIADVSGKGVPAALFMVISRTLIKTTTFSGIYTSPADILRSVNNKLCEGNEDTMFVTVWLGILTISSGTLVSANAGHEYPVFYRKNQGFYLEKDHHGMIMGVMENVRYKDTSWKLNAGDMVFVYTDGLPEANNSREELFDIDRMMDALDISFKKIHAESTEAGKPGSSSQTDLKGFLREVRGQIDEFVGDAPQFDDLTMLCLEYKGLSPTNP